MKIFFNIVQNLFTFFKIFVIIMSKMIEENKMKAYKITLTTSADGKETQIIRNGKALLSLAETIVVYREENAEITLTFKRAGVKIERRGDYDLSLSLEQDKTTEGTLGLGGSVGGIRAHAHKISYSIGKDSLLAFLHYALIFDDERQEMKLRLYAKEDERKHEGDNGEI